MPIDNHTVNSEIKQQHHCYHCTDVGFGLDGLRHRDTGCSLTRTTKFSFIQRLWFARSVTIILQAQRGATLGSWIYLEWWLVDGFLAKQKL